MNDVEFLRRLAEGYVRCYRRLNLRSDSTWEDVTGRELGLFADLGERLGYASRYEVQRTDLTWHDLDSKAVILKLERESDRTKVLADTLPRLFGGSTARYLAAVLGWVRETDLEPIRQSVKANLGDRSMLVLAWVGPDPDAAIRLEALVYVASQVVARRGKGEVDPAGYWYADFVDSWK